MTTTIIITAACLIFAIFCVIFLKNEVRCLFPRIRGIGKGGVTLGDPVAPNQAEVPETNFQRELDEISRSAIQLELEANLKKELENRKISDTTDQVKFLTTALAETLLSLQFSRISNGIFGSQLELLINLNSNRDGLLSKDVEMWYTLQVIPNKPEFKDFAFEKWLGFLEGQKLLERRSEKLAISPLGIEFLGYLVKSGETHKRLL